MPFKIQEMFDTIKFFAEKYRNGSLSEKEVKNQIFQKAMQEARSARGCCGQVRYVRVVDLLQEFVEGLYYPLNYPVVDVEFFSRSLHVSKASDIAAQLQEDLSILETSHMYQPFCRGHFYLLGMAKAALIEKRGESLLFAASLFKMYLQAFSQVMEVYCECK